MEWHACMACVWIELDFHLQYNISLIFLEFCIDVLLTYVMQGFQNKQATAGVSLAT